jgi:hypothetical protein
MWLSITICARKYIVHKNENTPFKLFKQQDIHVAFYKCSKLANLEYLGLGGYENQENMQNI